MGKPFDPYYLWLGIPPAEQPPHHYRLLGLTLFESNVEVVSQAADRQMAFVQMHKTGRHSAESQRLLNELSSARLCLLNPAKKAAYDEALRKKLEPLPPASPVAAGASAASVFAPAVPVVPGSSGVNTSAEGAIPPAMPAPFVAPPGGVNPFAAAPIVGPASGAPANPFASGPMHVAPVNYGAAPGFGSAGPSGASPYAPASIARPIAVPPVAAPPADARESDSAFAAPFSVDTTGSHRRNKRLTPAKLGAIVGGVAALLAVVYAILSSSSDAPPAIVDRRDPAHPASNAGEASSSGEGAPQGEATGPNVRAAAAEATSGTRAPVAHVIAPPTGAPNGANTPRVRVAQPHVIGAADSSRDANATGGASGAPDTLESAPNGGLRWPPGYGWSFADFPLGDQRQTLIADADGFAGFAGIHGGMHGFGEHLGFERANGSWSMTGRGGQPGFGGSALTIKSPIRGFEFRQYGWTTGEAPVEMIPARDGFCLLTSVSGSFMGDGEWVKVDVNEAGNWRLYGNGVQGVAARAVAFIVPRWNGTATFHEWRSGRPTVDIMNVREGFCFLNGIGGAFRGNAEYVRVGIDKQRWTLAGGTALDSTFGMAVAIRVYNGTAPNATTPRNQRGTRTSLAELAPDFAADGSLTTTAPRLPAPEEFELTVARKEFDAAFGSQLAKADKPAEKSALSRTLLGQGKSASESPANRYALLERAGRLAGDAKQTTLAWEAWDELARVFDVNVLPQKSEVLAAASGDAKTPDDAKLVAQAWLVLLNQALAADEYDQATRYADLADGWIRKSGDDVLRKLALKGRDEVKALSSAFAQVRAAKEALVVNPDDAEAAFAWGRFACLYKNDFARGLPNAAKGTGPLADAAKLELARPQDGNARLIVADAWWTIGESEPEPLPKKLAQQRATHWYRAALPSFSGIEKKRIENQLAAFDEAYPVVPRNEWVDVLGMVDLNEHVLRSSWTRQGSAIASRDNTTFPRVAVPVIPAGAYDLEVKFVRRDGDDTISVGVPVGDRHVNIALSAERGRAHAIYTVDGKGADNNPASVKPGALVNGREYTLDVKVVPNGDRAQIEVQLDGRRLIRWEGRTASLSQSPGTREDPLCIWLEAADARVTYREARLRVRSGAVRLGTL